MSVALMYLYSGYRCLLRWWVQTGFTFGVFTLGLQMSVALGYSHWGYRCMLLWGIHIGVIDVCCFGVFTLGL